MYIRTINKSVNDIIQGAEYLGQGASKEGYLKNGIVYKIPRGRYLIEESDIDFTMKYPDTMNEVNDFLEKIDEREGRLVWPLGQFAIELIVWNAIQQLKDEGLKINCFAEIKDFYFDKNGVIVIEQEMVESGYDSWDKIEKEVNRDLWHELVEEINKLEPVLEDRFNIYLRDVRDGNAGIDIKNKVAKLFDFGISTSTDLDNYGSYSCYENYDSYYEGDSY